MYQFMSVHRGAIVRKMGLEMRFNCGTLELKVPCSATELPAQPGWSLPNLVGSWDVDALPFGIVGTLGPPGEVEGSGERYHEPRQDPELEHQVQELLRADGLLRFGRHQQDAPYDGYEPDQEERLGEDRKSTRLNSSHQIISYAVFCLKKKNKAKRPAAGTPSHGTCACSGTPRLCWVSAGLLRISFVVFFFNDTATTEIYTLSLHDALPISGSV